MVTVIPGSDLLDLYAKRNIVSTNVEGDGFFVRRSANDSVPDPRSNSFWQKDVQDRLGLASKIWKNKPGCWQDFFKRSKKRYKYSTQAKADYFKELSGYQLAMNVLISSIDFRTGTYFDPKCFCLNVVDPVGQNMPTWANLHLETDKQCNFVYDEYHKLMEYVDDRRVSHFRFCSASAFSPISGGVAKLTNQFSIPRNRDGGWWGMDLHKIKDIPSWFPLKMKTVDLAFPIEYFLYHKERWIFEQLDPIYTSDEREPLNRFKCTWVDPSYCNSLCNYGAISFIITYNSFKCIIEATYSDGDPKYDVYFGDILLGRMGAGVQSQNPLKVEVSPNQFNSMDIPPISFEDYTEVPPRGRQPYHTPVGKVTTVTADDIVYTEVPRNSCTQYFTDVYFHTDDYISFDGAIDSPQIRFGVFHVDENPPSFMSGYPKYGYPILCAGKDKDPAPLFSVSYSWGNFYVGQLEHCARNLYYTGNYNNFIIRIQNTDPFWNGITRTMIGEPGTEPDPVCPHRPKIENVKISFLEYNKNP